MAGARERSQNITKKTSKKQTTANRRNAKKSTGPRTSRGKDVIKFNALRHGLTAETSVIPSTGFEENQEEFDALQLHLRAELQPVGIMEDLLVTKITSTFWRQRRLLKAEVGEIEKNWDQWKSERISDLKSARDLSNASPHLFPPLDHYCSYTEGVEHLIAELKTARDAVLIFGHTR